MTEETILFEMLTELKKLNNINRLWSIDDVADYFAMGRTTARNKIINNPSFPKPITIQNTLPRWEPEEVKAWAKTQRS